MVLIQKLLNKYKIFIKYVFSAGICTVIDLSFFTVINFFLKKSISPSYSIIISSVIARVISSCINFLINGKIVFSEKDKLKFSMMLQYYLLVVIQMCVSSLSVAKLYSILLINETVIKFFVDLAIFFVNYFVQKKIIFKNKVVIESGTTKRNK